MNAKDERGDLMGGKNFQCFLIFPSKANFPIILWSVILFFLLFAYISANAALSTEISAKAEKSDKQSIIKKALVLQLPFVANQGQINDQRVLYYARTFVGTAYITNQCEIVYQFQDSPSKTASDFAKTPKVWLLKEKLVGASLNQPKGIDPSRTRVSFFIGNEKSKWKTNVPTYDEVSLGETYKGIHLTLRAYGNNVEKIFTVQPGATPKLIKLNLEGAKSLKINKDGELEALTDFGVIRFGKPIGYQLKKGKKIAVPIDYVIDKGLYGFVAKNYDKRLPLIIDPVLNYSTLVGGSTFDEAYDIVVDTNLDAYITGYTQSLAGDLGGLAIGENAGGFDIFVARLTPGGFLDYFAFIGGLGDDIAHDIVLTGNSDPLVVGETTSSTDFPIQNVAPDGQPYQETFGGGTTDAFVSVISSNGQTLTYSSYLGGVSDDTAQAIAVDNEDGVYVVGYTQSSDFPPTDLFSVKETLSGASDAFVVKFGTNGETLDYATYIGGSVEDEAYGIAVDGQKRLYIVGGTSSGDFPDTVGGYGPGGGFDAFISRLDPDVSPPYNPPYSTGYSTTIGGTGADMAGAIVIDGLDNAYITGDAAGDLGFPVTNGSYQSPDLGGSDVFVAKINTEADPIQNSLLFSALVGGTNQDYGNDIGLDSSGNIYITGRTEWSDPEISAEVPFPTSIGTPAHGGDGANDFDAFIAMITNNGAELLSSRLFGGTEDQETGRGLFIDNNGNVYLTGTGGSGFPGSGFSGSLDAFVLSMSGFDVGTIRGTVTDFATSTGESLVTVRATDLESYTSWQATTESDGRYEITDLPAGCYHVQAFPYSEDIGHQISRGVFLDLAGGEIAPVDFSLKGDAYTISGQVSDSGGSPLNNAKVILRHRLLEIREEVNTIDGDYEFYNVPPGDIIVSVEPAAGTSIVEFYGTHLTLPAVADPGDYTLNLDLPADDACVSGEVRDENNDTVSDIYVIFESELHYGESGTTTEPDGSFSICGLPPGIGFVQAEPDAGTDPHCRTDSQAVFLVQGQTASAGTIKLQLCASVNGVVNNAVNDKVCALEVDADGFGFEEESEIGSGSYQIRMAPSAGLQNIFLQSEEEDPSLRVAAPVQVSITPGDIDGAPVTAPVMEVISAGHRASGRQHDKRCFPIAIRHPNHQFDTG
jgi:hypothetical protein